LTEFCPEAGNGVLVPVANIPVVVVDDERVDRFTVRRRLKKHGGFADVLEACSGDAFLNTYCSGTGALDLNNWPLLVLIDQNMPGRSGFETIAELEERQKRNLAPRCVVMMFISSNDPGNLAGVAATPAIRGHIEKPLDDFTAQILFDFYQRECERAGAIV